MANTAVTLNGTSQYISVASKPTLTTDEITIEAWVKRASASTGSLHYIASDYNSGANRRSWALYYDTNNKISFAVSQDGTFANTMRHTTNAAISTPDAWHHVVATFSAGTMAIYIDGAAVASTSDANAASAIYNNTIDSIYIGADSGTASYFGGTVDDVAIYDSALSAAAVSDLYDYATDGGLHHGNLAASLGALAHWLFDETSGTTAADAIASHDGTYAGSPTLGVTGIVNDPATPISTLPMTLRGGELIGMTLHGSLIRPAASLPMRLLADAVLPMSLAGSLIRQAATLPMSLETVLPRMTLQCIGALQSEAATLPMRLITRVESTAAALGMTLRGFTDADITATNQRWTVELRIDNTPVERLVGQIEIQCEETASGTCRFDLLPAAGEVDPDDYERKRVTIDYVALTAAGVEQWRSRRFTGVTLTATYDPDTGVMSVEGSHELQSWLEDIDPDIEQDAQRATIAGMVGGTWSPHIFEESADNWRYAQDRLSTQQACIYIDRLGYFQHVAWAAKSTADVVLTDSGRFGNTLRVERPDQRDLVTRVKIGMDFRFNRLRHREIRVVFNTPGLCSYLNQGWELPAKSMIQSATEQGGWTRISDVRWSELPGPLPNVCTPPRAWAGNADAFCLGASWTAARRWAQRVNEDYTIEVSAPNLEDVIGQRVVTEDYGVEATYDATDFENITSFDDRPAGATLLPDLDDWAVDAEDAEYDGRTAFTTAKAVAVAKAQSLIAERARGWRVSLECPWRPDIGLDTTLEVDTPYLECKGKVFGYRERFDFDSGETMIAPVIALSRHYNPESLPADPVLSAVAVLPMALTGSSPPI